MKVSLEVRISIRDMLKSTDLEVQKVGWILFLDEYEKEIIRKLKNEEYASAPTTPWEALDFLNRSIAISKGRMNEKNKTNSRP